MKTGLQNVISRTENVILLLKTKIVDAIYKQAEFEFRRLSGIKYVISS